MIKEKVKDLWKLCFNDSEEFTELYFRLRYKDEVSLFIESGEEIISALQTLPYPMTFCGKEIQTAYISGACTHPDYRGRGVMSELLKQTYTRLWQKRISVSTLIPGEPWLFDYYARLGYAPVFRHTVRNINSERIVPVTGALAIHTTAFNEKHYQYLNRKLSEMPCCVQHTTSDYRVMLESLELSHSYVYIVMQNDQVAGLAVAWKGEDGITIDALFAENKASEQALLYHIYKVTKSKDITLLGPHIPESNATPLGMVRIINAEEILKQYAAAHPKIKMEFELIDQQLSANNGCYKMGNGRCLKVKEKEAHIRMTIGELSQKIFSPLHPYMSMMLHL